MGQNMELAKSFPLSTRSFWQRLLKNQETLEEIRIRADKPIIIREKNREWYVDREGKWIREKSRAQTISFGEIQELVDYWCQDSRYAFQKELKSGYLTLQGGHRIGICGETVVDAQGEIKTIKNISSLNIRIAHECKTVGENILPLLYEDGFLHHTLIISPPGAGKTTMLRDLIRRISDGSDHARGKTVGVVDERGEIAACHRGIPQLDVGLRTDVMDGCPKIEGMARLLRSMAPQVIAVDELGDRKEMKALMKLAGCGCSILATVHGRDVKEIKEKRMFKQMWEENIFGRILILERKNGEFTYVLLDSAGKKEDVRIC